MIMNGTDVKRHYTEDDWEEIGGNIPLGLENGEPPIKRPKLDELDDITLGSNAIAPAVYYNEYESPAVTEETDNLLLSGYLPQLSASSPLLYEVQDKFPPAPLLTDIVESTVEINGNGDEPFSLQPTITLDSTAPVIVASTASFTPTPTISHPLTTQHPLAPPTPTTVTQDWSQGPHITSTMTKVEGYVPPHLQNNYPHHNNAAAFNHTAPSSDPKTKTMTQLQAKHCMSTLKSIKRLRDATPFLVPVDPVRLNIPDYPLIIKHPMDMSTIERKLSNREYFTVEQFVTDFILMFDNCIRYNGPNSGYAIMAANVRKSFEKQMERLPSAITPAPTPASASGKTNKTPRASQQQQRRPSLEPGPRAKRESASSQKYSDYDSTSSAFTSHAPAQSSSSVASKKSRKPPNDLKYCRDLIRDLFKKQYHEFTYPFLQAVDPKAVPEYYNVIKSPIDLSVIKKKADEGRYEDAEDFEDDMQLLINNCFRFNPPDSSVHAMGRRLRGLFRQKWAQRPSTTYDPSIEVDESDDETSANIAALERQVMAMQQQLEQMRSKQREKRMKKVEQKRRGSPPSQQNAQNLKVRGYVGGVSSSRNSNVTGSKTPKSASRLPVPARVMSEPQIEVTFEMKRHLTESINFLPVEKMHQVYGIIQESMPDLQDMVSGEVELDMMALDNNTIYRIWQMVVEENSRKAETQSQLNPIAQMKQSGHSSDEDGDSDSSGSDSD